jgi:hypothetical protein
MEKLKIFGAILFIVGFTILIANVVDYLGGFFGLSWEIHLPSSAIGVVFIALGMYCLRLFAAGVTDDTQPP